jgi:anti-sigma-K factor RskA
MNYTDPELRERLAADYALGTLRDPARRRFERLLADDPGLADLAQDWELRVNLLADSAPAVEPPAHVWDRIAQRIGQAPAPVRESRLKRWWDSLGFWRGVGAVAAAAAAALAFHVALQPPRMGPELITALDQRLTGIETRLAAVDTTTRVVGALDERLARIESTTQGLVGTPGEIAGLAGRLAGIENRLNAANLAASHVAVLIDKYQRPMMTADLDVKDGRLALQLHIKPPRDFTGKMLEVWMTQPDGTSRSLGMFPSGKSGTAAVLVLSRDVAEALVKGGLAVSLEPLGGSTTGAPTGPVLFSGAVQPVDL